MAKSKSIGRVAVVLTAVTSPFRKAFARAGKTLTKFAKRSAAIAGSVIKMGAAMGAVAAGGIALMVKKSFAAIDALAKMADNVGATTEGLAGLQLAGELAGVSADQVGKALEKMRVQIGDAAQGTGEAAGALKQLGLDAKALSGLTADEQFRAIAAALQGVSNETLRTSLAYDIFGRQGVKLQNLLRQTTAELDESQRFMEKTGNAINRIDAAKIEMANDAISRMSKLASGVFNQIAVALAPAVKDIADRITEWGTSGEGAAKKVRNAIGVLLPVIGKIADVFNLVRQGVLLFKSLALTSIATVARKMDEFANGAIRVLNKLPGVTIEAAKSISFMADALEMEAGKAHKAFEDLANAPSASDQLSTWFEEVTKKATMAGEKIADARKEAQKASAASVAAPALAPATASGGGISRDGPSFGLRTLRELGAQLAGGPGVGSSPSGNPISRAQKKTNDLLSGIDRLFRDFISRGAGLA